MLRLSLLTLMATAIVVLNATSASARSLPGSSLEEAQKDDFFEFFHLKKRAIDERDDLATHYFRPPSRDDVVVCVDTDKSGTILQMSLIVGRDFIDNPKTNIFARDLVKSFIEAATPVSSASETADVVSEIFLRGSGPVTIETDAAVVKNQHEQNAIQESKTTLDTTSSGEGKPQKGDVVTKSSGADDGSISGTAKDSAGSDETKSPTNPAFKTAKQKVNPNRRIVKLGEGDIKKGDLVILSDGALPKFPDKISDSFRAFEGKLENADTPITGAHLIMKNHEVPKGRFLEVRIDLNSVKKEPKLEVVVDEAPEKDSDDEK